ncbi:MAG: hypothetical protein JWN86_726 [Planctomycetota bacterium]|nr:hypothetical protein [Planctomycetota bacterium]
MPHRPLLVRAADALLTGLYRAAIALCLLILLALAVGSLAADPATWRAPRRPPAVEPARDAGACELPRCSCRAFR